jgi:CheY-like chemotaxis protein
MMATFLRKIHRFHFLSGLTIIFFISQYLAAPPTPAGERAVRVGVYENEPRVFKQTPDEFDLIITDTAMPGISGDKLAIELMKIRKDIPVILCTGYSKKISEDILRQIGVKGLIYKPFIMADVAKKIRSVLDGVKVPN